MIESLELTHLDQASAVTQQPRALPTGIVGKGR